MTHGVTLRNLSSYLGPREGEGFSGTVPIVAMRWKRFSDEAFLRVHVARLNRELADWAHDNRYDILRHMIC